MEHAEGRVGSWLVAEVSLGRLRWAGSSRRGGQWRDSEADSRKRKTQQPREASTILQETEGLLPPANGRHAILSVTVKEQLKPMWLFLLVGK